MDLVLRVATADDRDAVFALLRGAALWLRGREIDYWRNWLDPPAHHVRWVEDGLSCGEFRIIESAGAVIGCVRLQDSDQLFWGSSADPAVYIHSLTIDRSLAGRGIGARVLEMIGAEASARGARWVRLDCGKNAEALRAYYESCGFDEAGECLIDGEVLTLFQKRMT